MDAKQAKQRFGIIGNDAELIRAIDVALQVAPTDISVFVYGESGTGKENIPKDSFIIAPNQLSHLDGVVVRAVINKDFFAISTEPL